MFCEYQLPKKLWKELEKSFFTNFVNVHPEAVTDFCTDTTQLKMQL
jgi:hypothetical protein